MVALLAFLNKTVASYLQSEILEIVKLLGGLKQTQFGGRLLTLVAGRPWLQVLWVSEEGV